jgi:hypothetical protein
MRTWLIAVLLPMLLLFLRPVVAAPPVIGIDTLLRSETDLSQLPRLRDWTSNLQSSYDRTGGNGDAQNFLATDGTTATLADMKGPGAVVRLWSANPNGQVKIYIDNAPAPILDMPLAKLLDGTFPPFVPPLTQASSGGFYSYLPIPYAKHCRITVDQPKGLYYQVNFLTFAPKTVVRPFALPLTAADQTALQAAVSAWQTPTYDTLPHSITYRHTVALRPSAVQEIDTYRGPGTIRLVQVQALNAADTDLRRMILRGYFDGHKTPDIEAPLADFFGNGYGHKAFTSFLLRQTPNGQMEARFPMPFGRSSHFTIENGTSKVISLVWRAWIIPEPFYPQEESYFHARWFQEVTKRGTPHLWTQVRGQRGHFVGIVQTMAGSRNLGFLEGDDQFRVDAQSWGASKVPTTVVAPWNGTGTEDCFNSGWYFDQGTNALPVNGVLVKDQVERTGRINAYRWFLNDAPVFQHSLDAQIEHGGANDAPNTDYSSVAYWYADGPTQPWSPMPPAAQIEPPHSPVPAPQLTLLDPIEGESLITFAQVSTGRLQVQDMSGYDGSWSGDHQLWWVGGKVGDTLTLTLPTKHGTYDLRAYFTQAADYGQFTFTLNSQPVGKVFDAYHDGVVNSGPVLLGRVTLLDDPAKFIVTIHGKNADASNTLFGLDAFVLTPVK